MSTIFTIDDQLTTSKISIINGYINNDPISVEVMETIEFVFGCVLIDLFAALGLAGTLVNLVVLSRYNITTDSSNILLLSLSVADFMFCLTIPISRSKCLLTHMFDIPTALNIHILIFEYFSGISRVFYNCSITMVGVISVERFLVVFVPFRSALLMTPFRMKIVSIAVYVANFLLFSPAYFSFTHDNVFSEKYQAFVPVLKPTEFYKNNYEAVNVEVGIVYSIAVLGSAMLLTLILTPAMAIKLWVLTTKRAKLINRRCHFEPQIVKILLTICSMSLIIYGPLIFYQLVIFYLPQFSVLSKSFQVFLNVTDFCGTVCASVNFLIYVTMSGKFRQKYKELVCRLCVPRGIN